jgi:hypothetical protein
VAGQRAAAGWALLAGAVVMGLLAILAWIEVLPFTAGTRTIVAIVLALGAITDLFIGLRFLQESE